jgi:hypothetical protein
MNMMGADLIAWGLVFESQPSIEAASVNDE